MQPEYIKGMPRPLAIKRALLYVLIAGCVLVASEKFLLPWIKSYLSVANKAEALSRLKIFMLGLSGWILLPALYAGFLARRIFEAKQFPLPDARVIRDTLIVRGRKALIRAWIILGCSIVLFVCAIYAACFPYLI
jgi:hypothetical protein